MEPVKQFACNHTDAIIWANRKVTLRGAGALEAMNPVQRAGVRLRLTIRQLLCALTGRNI